MVALILEPSAAKNTVATQQVNGKEGMPISEGVVDAGSGKSLASSVSTVRRIETLKELASNAGHTACLVAQPTFGSDAAFSAEGRVGGRPSLTRPRRAVYRPKTLRDKDRRTQHWTSARKRCARILESQKFELAIGITILFNIGVLIMQANESASEPVDCKDSADSSCGSTVGYVYINALLLAFYTAELALRMYTYRDVFFKTYWNNMDLAIVLTGIVDLVIDVLHTSKVSRGLVGLLRFFRATRICRAFRLLAFIPELYRLIQLLSGALRALFWGFILIVFMIIFWSLVTIEFVKPVVLEFGGEDCAENFNSIWHTAIYFFQILVVVDDWGACVVPLVLEKPWTIIFFGFAVITVQLFFMNLILSAIVDSAAAAREQDHEHRALENERLAVARMEKWKMIYASMDVQVEGFVSREELVQSFDDEDEVREFLQGLDITKQDLGDIFDLMDEDGSGLLPYDEFVNTFVKAQSQDARIYMMTVKLQTNHLLQAVREQAKQIQDIRTTVRSSAERIAKDGFGLHHHKDVHEDGESSGAFSSLSARSIVSVPPTAEAATPMAATPRRTVDSEPQPQPQHTNGERNNVSQCSATSRISDVPIPSTLGTDLATHTNDAANNTREDKTSKETHHSRRMLGSSERSTMEVSHSRVSAKELMRCLSAQLAEMQRQLTTEIQASVQSALLKATRSSACQLESTVHVLNAAGANNAAAASHSPKDVLLRAPEDDVHGASTCMSTADSLAKRDEPAQEGTLGGLEVVRSCYV